MMDNMTPVTYMNKLGGLVSTAWSKNYGCGA